MIHRKTGKIKLKWRASGRRLKGYRLMTRHGGEGARSPGLQTWPYRYKDLDMVKVDLIRAMTRGDLLQAFVQISYVTPGGRHSSSDETIWSK